MEERWGIGLVLCLGIFVGCSFAQDNADNITGVYIVTLKQAPTSHYYGELRVKGNNGSGRMSTLNKPRFDISYLFIITCFLN